MSSSTPLMSSPSTPTSPKWLSNASVTFLDADDGQPMTLNQAVAHASRYDQLAELGGKLGAMLDQEEQVSRWGSPGGQLTLHREDSASLQSHEEAPVPVGPVKYRVLMLPTSVTTHLLMPIQAKMGSHFAEGTETGWTCRLDDAVQRVKSKLEM